MMDRDNANGFNGMQQVFGFLEPARSAWARNWVNYWQSQEKILDRMEEFSRGWFERRHEAAAEALHAAERACEARTPADMVGEFQAWMTGSMQRIAADNLACQKHLMAVAEAARSLPVSAAEQVAAATAGAREKARGAAEHAEAA
jgi:hypothetical protein